MVVIIYQQPLLPWKLSLAYLSIKFSTIIRTLQNFLNNTTFELEIVFTPQLIDSIDVVHPYEHVHGLVPVANVIIYTLLQSPANQIFVIVVESDHLNNDSQNLLLEYLSI
jgi:hypothetical protein